jgi:hypothetical protein
VFESSCDAILGLTQLRPPVQFVLDCRPDERILTRIGSRFDRFIDSIPVLSAQSIVILAPRTAPFLSHKVALQLLRGFRDRFLSVKYAVKHLSNADVILFDDSNP